MLNINYKLLVFYVLLSGQFFSSCSLSKTQEVQESGNPVFDGWYADPEGVVFDNRYWIFPTYSAPFEQQLFLDAFSSSDLVSWKKHSKILSVENVSWLKKALWAPSIIYANKKYYLYFSANDVHEGEIGGIGVAVADSPEGPFKDALGKPLINEIINGAQPIDQFVFKDDDGSYYMYYGGWGHCNMMKLGDDFLHIVPYVEGPFMLKHRGKYYFMWSEGDWTGPGYCVAYAIADSPFGPLNV